MASKCIAVSMLAFGILCAVNQLGMSKKDLFPESIQLKDPVPIRNGSVVRTRKY